MNGLTLVTVCAIWPGKIRNLAFLASRLKEGEMVAVPTETVYGLAANALNPLACAKIFRAKGRPRIDPLIVHIHSLKELPLLCNPSDTALRLAKRFWPGHKKGRRINSGL